ncbi:hypothetical protein HYD96_00925 [Mycoplasmopsis bovis]|nr:hypothetical protein [Mycoplasmopsis bovis]QQH34615.1 hypothetical protein HYD96_00925 [Mycoplasmopsis bovis]
MQTGLMPIWLKQMFTNLSTIDEIYSLINDQNAINKLLDKAAKRNEDSMNCGSYNSW